MQTQWDGHYLDGRTAARQQATIWLTRTGLQFTTERGVTLWWPYQEIRQSQGFYAGEQVRLERGGELPEVLLVSDPSFLTHLHRVAPGVTSRFHDPSRRRLRAQLTILAALAVIGLTVVLYLWVIPAMAALAAARVPVSWEERLGAAAVEHLAPEAKRCTDPALARALDQILTTLTRPLPRSPYTFRLIVLNDSALNAFAAPGGYIVVLRGLLERSRSAEELAGVLAHELQHVLRRHTTRALLQDASTGLLIAALAGDVSGAMAYGLESARTLGALRYSRQAEEEADREGLRLLRTAGIDPAGMIAFFDLLGTEGKDSPELFKYLSTHPSPADRIERLRSLAGQPQQRSARLLEDPDWREIRTRCESRASGSRRHDRDFATLMG